METVFEAPVLPTGFDKLIAGIVGYIIIGGLILFLTKSVNKYVSDPGLRYRAKKVFIYAGYVVIIIFTVILFNEQLGGVSVVLGVAGAGIAFALQEVIMSIAGWVAISFGNFYSPTDRIQLGGITGDVIDIGILRTTLMETGQWVQADLYNGRVVRIANSFVFKEPVFNYSGSFPFLWDEIKVPIKYGCDHHWVRQTLNQIANQVTSEYASEAQKAWNVVAKQYVVREISLAPQVTLVATDNWIEFTLRYVVDYRYRRTAKDTLFSAILDRVRDSEGKMAIASTTVHIVEAPSIRVTADSSWNV